MSNVEDNIEMRDQNPFGIIKKEDSQQNKMKIIVGIIVIAFVLILIIIILAFVGRKILLKPAPSWKSPRLPDWQIPQHYDLQFSVDPSGKTFSGSSTINIIFKNITTDAIVLSGQGLQITSHMMRVLEKEEEFETDTSTTYVNGDQVIYDNVNNYILIKSDYLKKAPAAGNVLKYLQLKLKWTGSFQTSNLGIFKSTYYDEKGNQLPYVATNFAPTSARLAFPCFDEPQLVSTFTLTINTTTSQGTVLSNMPYDNNEVSKNVKSVRFQTSPVMSTFDLTFVVSNFPSVVGKVGKSLVNVYVPPRLYAFADSVLKTSSNILSFYNNYLQYNYTFTKLDIVAIPGFYESGYAGPGIIFVRSRDLMNDNNSTRRNVEDTHLILSHEICSQWFGEIMRVDWWNKVWLHEGICTFFQYYVTNELNPDWDIWERLELDMERALFYDSLRGSRILEPAANTIRTVAEIADVYNEINAYKGAAIIYMLYDRLEAVEVGYFQAAITNFINRNANTFVDGNDLITAFEDSASFPVRDYIKNWIYTRGYPVISFTRKTSTTFVAKQKLFYLEDPAPTPQSWWVSLLVQYETKLSRNYRYKFNQTSESPAFAENMNKSPYFIANPARIGFYRVLYTPEMMNNITYLLSTQGPDVFEVEDIAGLLDDILVMSRTVASNSTVYPLSRFFEISTLLVNSRNPNLWEAIIRLYYRLDTLMNHPEDNSKYDDYAQYLFASVYNYVGLNPKPSDSHHDKILRSLVLPFITSHNVSGCADDALSLFRNFSSYTVVLDPDVQVGIFTAAVKYGTAADYQWLKNRFLSTPSEDEANRILLSFAEVEDPTLLNDVLNMLIDKSLNSFDGKELATHLAKHHPAQVWTFFKNNWNTFVALYPDYIESLLIGISKNFVTRDLVNGYNDFVTSNRITLTPALKDNAELVASNLNWYTNRSPDVLAWVNNWQPNKRFESIIFN